MQTISPVIGEATVQELREAVKGEVIAPGDEGYPEACRVWNGMFDSRRPALVVRCEGTADVIAAVGFARSNDLPLAVRGGAHSVAGFSTTRRRARDRPLADAERPRRPGARDSRTSAAGDLGRCRPRDAGPRARDDGRARLDDRRRRLHARRRHRLADAQARPRLRQPRRRRRRHRRRAGRPRDRDREPRAPLGPARRRRQLRRRRPSSSSTVHPVGPLVHAGPIFYPADADVAACCGSSASGPPTLRTRSPGSSA